MKKLLAISIIVIILCLTLCSCGTSKSSPIEDFEYEFKDGTVTITGYIGSDLEIVIPSVIEERSVTTIGEKAFKGYDMTSIVIPDGVTTIEEEAFKGCKLLENITFPNTLKCISKSATKDTTWYENQPEGIISSNNVVMGYKESIPSIVIIEEGTKTITDGALITNSDKSISKIYIPKSVTYIGYHTGYYSYYNKNFNNTDWTIQSNLTIYGEKGSAAEEYANENNIKFSTGDITDDTDSSDTIGYVLETTESELKNDKFGFSVINPNEVMITEYLGSDTEVVIPESFNNYTVTSISNSVFQRKNITSVEMPDTIKEIQDYAFANNSNLTSVKLSSNLEVLGTNVFFNCQNLESIEFPSTLKEVGVYAFSATGLKCLTIPESSTFNKIDEYTFYQCPNLMEVILPSTITEIADNAFTNCSENITIYAPSDSYAEKYANKNNINFVTQ